MRVQNFIIRLCLAVLFVIVPGTLVAQKVAKGTVTTEDGEPLIGVAVKLVSDPTKGVVTDFDGNFMIAVKNNKEVLEFSYLGYQAQELVADVKKPMSVVLKEDSELLDEVVVIGYQTVKRRDLTGSVGQPNIADMTKTPVSSFDQALAGRVAGVQVSSGSGAPGGGMNIVIRGKSTLTGSTDPLYVVDGFITDSAVGRSINPNDIASIDILKDASAAAIYGKRGANGVIIITTKQGKMGELQVSYDFDAGVHWVPETIDMMDAYEFVKLQAEISPKDISSSYLKEYEGHQYTLEDFKGVPQYDWQNEIFQTAWQQSHNIRLTGGSKEARYNASFRYFDQDGVVINSNFNRLQGSLGTNIRQGRLRINLNSHFDRSVKLGVDPSQSASSGMNNLFYSVWGYRPVTEPGVPLNSLMDNIRDESVDSTNDYRFNPIMSLNNEYRKFSTTIVRYNGFAEYELAKNLYFKVSGNYVSNKTRNETFNNSRSRYGYPGSVNGINAQLYLREISSWLNENTVRYNTTINRKHHLNGVAGLTFDGRMTKLNTIQATQIDPAYEGLGMGALQNGKSDAYSASSTISKTRSMSVLGRVNYDYDGKYYLTASFRADASSNFAKRNRWGYFPSFSVAWNFMEEDFAKPISTVLSSGKLRAGWGQLGNDGAALNAVYDVLGQKKGMWGYTSSGQYGHAVYPIGGRPLVGVVPVSFGNEALKWETTDQSNLGIDLSFFNDRLTFTTDLYYRRTRDLLDFTNLPMTTGHGGAWVNVGEVTNKGVEFAINTINIQNKDFTWTSNFNISFNKNKLNSLNHGQAAKLDYAQFDQNFNSQPSYIAKVGHSIGMMYGYEYEGTYKYDDFTELNGQYTLKPDVPAFSGVTNTQPGYPKFKDINGDGVIDANDRTIIGRGDPIHTGGFTNNFTYKDFDLSIFMQWSYGNDILNANKLMFESGFNKKKNLNQFASFANRWTPDNPESNIPRVSNASSNMVFSSRVIEDGSFLRLKNITLGYTLPTAIAKKMYLESMRVYVAANNLITFTSYSGYDPEVSVRNSALTPGLDFSSYPRSTSFHFGVNLEF